MFTSHTHVCGCFQGLHTTVCFRRLDVYSTDKCLCFQEFTCNCLFQETRCLLTNICVSGAYCQRFLSCLFLPFRSIHCLFKKIQCLPTNTCVFRVYLQTFVSGDSVFTQLRNVCLQGTTVIKPSTRCLSGHSTQATKAAPSPESSTPTTYVT